MPDPRFNITLSATSRAMGAAPSAVLAATRSEARALIASKNAAAVTAPANTVAPAITGVAQVGVELTCTDGTWTGSPTLSKHWFVGGFPIGVTGNVYTPVVADIGKKAKVSVNGFNGGGHAAVFTAETADVVAA